MKLPFFFRVYLCFIFVTTINCSCPSIDCSSARCAQQTDCKDGYSKKGCPCCTHCIRYLGDRCGGPDNKFGICADGLQCFSSRNDSLGVCQCKYEKCKFSIDLICPNDSYKILTVSNNDGCCHMPSCACLPDECAKPVCLSGKVLRLRSKGTATPGSCCDQFDCISVPKNCDYKNEVYKNGEQWHIDNCTTCICKNGFKFCKRISCDYGNCNRGSEVNECCPRCESGCVTENGIAHKHNDIWSEDDCTTCQCINGRSYCTPTFCKATCSNPRKVVGHCCPICEDCDLICENGKKHDDNGEEMCECNPVLTDNCLSIETCEKHCLNGYHLSSSGCSSCYCMSCRNITQTEPKCDKMCANGFKQDEHGCYLCECNVTPAIGNNSDNCAVNGLTYMQNEQWNVHCRKCKCLKGKQICKDIVCTQQVCENLLLRNCCSMCNASRLSVKSLCDSELMKHELHNLVDKCLNCTCEKDSNLYCELNYCPVAACETPVTNGPNCCPYCNNSNATKYEQLNSKSCVWKGKWYADGGQWRNSVCESCMCRDGIPFCFREHCYSLNNTCKHVIKVKNRCCPLCLDTELQNEHCEHNNQVYEHGKHWTLDSCWNCYCYHNRRICYNHCDHQNSKQENEQCCKEHTRQANILHLTTILLTSLASLLMLFTLLSCILKRQPQFGLSKILWPSTTSTATHTTDGNHDQQRLHISYSKIKVCDK